MRLNGGVSLVSRPPAFSTDGKLLLVCTGSTVSIFSVATGLQVNELEGHTGAVTSVNVVEYGGATKSIVNHAWTSSLDGTVRFWNFTTGAVIRTVNVGSPIFSMVIPSCSEPDLTATYKQCICVLLIRCNKDIHKNKKLNKAKNEVRKGKEHSDGEPAFRVVLHNLSTEKPLLGHLAEIYAPQPLVCSQLSGLVGIVDDRKIWVWRVSKEGIKGSESFQLTILHHTKALQAVGFDPTETLVAGSDSSGRILIWKNVGEHMYVSPMQGKEEDSERKGKNGVKLDSNRGVRGDDDAAAMSTYHWHSDQVNFLKFSLDGAYLFSGGREGVFVMWQLETGKRRFLPRFGSSLLHCAGCSDASIFSVACADNTIKLVNIGTMAVQKSIQGIKPPVSLPRKIKAFDLRTVTYLPGSGNLVLPAQDMSLQFYDVVHDRQIGEVQVTPHNYVSSKEKERDHPERGHTSDTPEFITHVVFSKDGSVMATAECHMGEDNVGRGSCLKFWKRNSAKTDFFLSTQIDDPHGMEVSSLVFHPISNLAVSCCSAGEFKVWVCNESKQSTESSSGWRCRSVGSYRQKRMRCADFSSDGTLLAVAAEELITLWNPSSNGLVHVLARSTLHPIKTLRFVPSTNYLVAASGGNQPELTVWNLETLSICWSYHVAVEDLAVAPSSPYFAILGAKEKLARKDETKRTIQTITIFNVNSPVPYSTWNAQDVEESNMLWLPCLDISFEASKDDEKQDSGKPCLVFLNRQREYTIFDPLVQEDKSETASKKSFSRLKEEGPSAFASVYGKARNAPLKLQSDTTELSGAQPRGKLLNCPSHLISLRSIGFSYIKSLLERRTGVVQ
eukprot:c19220_g1_i1 orf=92-2614(+)